MIEGIAITIAMALGATGYGAGALRWFRVDTALDPWERIVYAFVLGGGILCWLAFLWLAAGLTSPVALWALVLIGALGLGLLRSANPLTVEGMAWLDRGLAILLCFVLAMDIPEALSPVADADTVAYHLDLPRRFVEAGKLYFVPFAIVGASPLLVHMGYAVAYGLGGETAFAVWSMLTTWGSVGAVAMLARRVGGLRVGLMAALLFATAPVVIYGGGSGQVETKLAGWVVLSTAAIIMAVKLGRDRPEFTGLVLLSAVVAGFYPASKYLGLFFVVAIGVIVLIRIRHLKLVMLFAIATAVAGGQWYMWNFVHSGDPVFPMLYGIIPYSDSGLWNESLKTDFAQVFFAAETPLDKTLWGWITYPFRSTFDPMTVWEAQRAGIGPVWFLFLPLAVLGWRFLRGSNARQGITLMLLIALMFYTLWFFIGSSQRVRHLLPIYPLVLVPILVAAQAYLPRGRVAFLAAIVLTLGFQGAMLGLASVKYLKFFAGQTREEFLGQNINNFAVVKWMNDNLPAESKILTPWRGTLYHIKPHTYLASPYYQAALELRPRHINFETFWRQSRELGLTHAVASHISNSESAPELTYVQIWTQLEKQHCVIKLATIDTQTRVSRTLSNLGVGKGQVDIYQYAPETCVLNVKPQRPKL